MSLSSTEFLLPCPVPFLVYRYVHQQAFVVENSGTIANGGKEIGH